jgi:beta-glucanase (GH16 family)
MIKPKSSNKRWQASVLGLTALAALTIIAGWAGITHNSPVYAATTVFDDEFNGTSLDTTAWVAVNRPGDTSNAEQQCYKPGNASVSGGNLVLLTQVDSSCAGYGYTSAMVQWKSFNFTYGYVEVRAKMAGGQGPWPAIWMLGANCQQTNITDPGNIPPCNWPFPGSDEIDITEILGSNHTSVNQQIHSTLGNPGCSAGVSDVSQNWHTYGLTWTAASVIWTIDGATTCTVGSAIPTHPMFLMLNTALGGVGGGSVNPASLPQSYFIDYVRVSQGTPPPAPMVTSMAPSSGPAVGGTPVVITGINLTGAIAVKFGTTPATTFTGISATQIAATSPAGSGPVDVTVTTPSGTSAISAGDKFTYTTVAAPTVAMLAPSTGPVSGGTPVTITGTNLTGATAVKFGSNAATAIVISATQITASSPAGSGTVDVTVTTPGGTSAISAGDKFTYTAVPAPTVTLLAPTSGPAAGGTSVVITGTNLTGATAVKFGATAAATFTVDSPTQITATSPAGLAGAVDVTVTTPGGTSAASAADQFTYSPAPTVALLAPGNGPTGGGTSVVITGTNFPITVGATVTVKFGATAGTGVAVNSATQITATSPAGSGIVDVTVTTAGGTSATSIADRFAYTLPPAAYTAVTPVRLLDTRNAGGSLGAGGVLNLTVAGVTPGAPAGASAVVLNVTVTNTTAASYLTVYPAGATRPLASSLNWAAGKTIPGLVTVQVGTGGAITIFNGVGSTDVVVDLEGYFAAPSGTAGGEVALTPARITDTRTGSGRPNAGSTLGVGGTITVQVTGAGGVPASGASAAILNVTVTNTSAAGALTVWPTGATRPLASNLNWVAGQTVPNRVFVPIGSGGQVSIFNFAGSADVVVDVSGYFTDATASGKLFTSVTPLRLVDTRLTGQTLGTAGNFILQVGGLGGVPVGASAVILNVTVTNTNAPSFLVAYPSTVGLPTASDLNWAGGQTVANMTASSLGTTGAVTFYNGVGSSDVVVDLAGWFS